MSTPFWVALLKPLVAALVTWLVALKKQWSANRAARRAADAGVVHEHTANVLHRLGPTEQGKFQSSSALAGIQEAEYSECS